MFHIFCLLAAVTYASLTAVFIYLQVRRCERAASALKQEFTEGVKSFKTLNRLQYIAVNKAVDKIIKQSNPDTPAE